MTMFLYVCYENSKTSLKPHVFQMKRQSKKMDFINISPEVFFLAEVKRGTFRPERVRRF